jgi:hypothetical protein
MKEDDMYGACNSHQTACSFCFGGGGNLTGRDNLRDLFVDKDNIKMHCR